MATLTESGGDDALLARVAQGGPDDVDAAVIEGASARVRPLIMTVATTVLGLLPLLWEAGVGADVSARTGSRPWSRWTWMPSRTGERPSSTR